MYYLIGDTHFCQDKLLQYGKRPFKTVEEMNETIINNWNNIVKDEDTVLVLGDFSFGNLNETAEICRKLKGKKVLIKGNWDEFEFERTWEQIGFDSFYGEPIKIYVPGENNSIAVTLSHEPVDIPSNEYNIHAHLHLDELSQEYPQLNPKNHICVSAELINYTPILLEEVMKNIERND